MMDSEKELRAIITELFQIIDQATLNIATWPQVDALRKRYQELQHEKSYEEIDSEIQELYHQQDAWKARYQALQQEKSEEHIWFQDDWI